MVLVTELLSKCKKRQLFKFYMTKQLRILLSMLRNLFEFTTSEYKRIFLCLYLDLLLSEEVPIISSVCVCVYECMFVFVKGIGKALESLLRKKNR